MKKILLLDDCSVQIVAIKKHLSGLEEGSEYELLTSSSAKDALETLEKTESVDIIISDLNMPDMNGVEFFAEVQKMPKFDKSFKLILTSEMRQDQKDQGAKVGINLWVIKPLSKVGLERILSLPKKSA